MSTAQDEFHELMRDKERRSAHPEDLHDDAGMHLNLSSDENDHVTGHEDDDEDNDNYDDDDEPAPRQSVSLARHTIPHTRYLANTGPKGVISDAQNFRDSHRMHQISVRKSLQLSRDPSPFGLSSRDQSPSEKVNVYDIDGPEGDDDGFMREWRNSRLKQLQGGGRGSTMQHRPHLYRSWSGLKTVDGAGYLDAVDKSPAGTVVVVYIYDEASEVSDELERCIRSLARHHAKTRFIKMHYQDAEMEPAGVPALLAYRGGEKFAGLVPLVHEIPDDADVSATTLEVLLKRHQILR